MKKKIWKKKAIHPAYTYLLLTFLVVILSGILSLLNFQSSYSIIDATTGEVTEKLVTVETLFNRTGIQYFVGNILTNFVNFAPLSILIVGLLGVGVAYKSGFLKMFIEKYISKMPKKLVTYLFVLFGIISSIFVEAGYVILLPISAIVFLHLKRNPILGLCATFSGITFGYGANVIVNSLDNGLIPYTDVAAKVMEKSYNVNLYGNIFFIAVASFALAYIGMYITEKFIVLKLGKYNNEEEIIEEEDSPELKRAFRVSMIFLGIIFIIFIYCLLPNLPYSGLFLDMKEKDYIKQLFGENSYISQGFIFLSSMILAITGIIYGHISKKFKNNNDAITSMSYMINNSGDMFILIFFASQFVEICKKTNIGVVLTSLFGNFINYLNFSGLPLVLLILILVMVSNLIVTSPLTKWAILSPTVVPIFMQNSMSPEFSQLVLRIGDSITKGITPLLAYFVIFVGFVFIYNKQQNKKTTLGNCLSLMIPYSIGYGIVWIVLLLCFYLIGLPIGVGIFSVGL